VLLQLDEALLLHLLGWTYRVTGSMDDQPCKVTFKIEVPTLTHIPRLHMHAEIMMW
jgi:hypothetical protein